MSLKLEKSQVESITALAPLQEGMLFEHMIDANLHQVVFHYTLKGSLIPAVLKQALAVVVRKNDILRTIYRWEGVERPLQLVLKEHTIPFNIFLVDMLDGDSIQQAVNRIKTNISNSINLQTSPLHIALQQGHNDEWHLIVVFHHIIMDGWSNAIVMEEWLTSYEQLLNGQRAVEQPAKLPYSKFVSTLMEQDFAAQQNYWNTYLHDFNRPSFVHNETAEQHYGHQKIRLSKQQTSLLQQVINEQHVTWAAAIYTAWGMLLQKYYDSQDLLFGITVSGRSLTLNGIENAVGLFINTIPFRVAFDQQQTIKELFEACSLTLRQGTDFVHTSLPKIREYAGIEGAGALFDTLVVIENYPINEAAIATMQSLSVSEVNVHETTPYGITLTVMLKQEGTEISFTYNQKQFSDAYIERMGLHLLHILEQLSVKPHLRLSEIEFITEEELHRYVVTDHLKLEHENRTLDQCFEEIARKLPEEIALIFKDHSLTYAKLNNEANSFANFLLTQFSISPDSKIGLCIPRSEKLLVALLGILKSGAAFVPIDPTMPEERIRYMVEDSGMIALITETIPAEQRYNDTKIISLQQWKQYENDYSIESVHSKSYPESLAYVIYTSGSTGKPKGVMVEHRNVTSFFEGLNEYLRPTQENALLAVTTISFDISILELLWSVCQGIMVVMKEDDSEKFQHYDSFIQSSRDLEISLFFFSNYDTNEKSTSPYSLLLEAAKFADDHDFTAVWTPERHFHNFGGLYANPAVTGAAIAAITKRIQIRAGSVVSPLHDPICIAEEWAMVDNLSKGRAGVSFASGWHADDFALEPQHYEQRNQIMFEQIEEVKALWSGNTVKRTNGLGIKKDIQAFPRPVQAKLPIWVTTGGSTDSFERAGQIGANVLTHLLGQDIEKLMSNIQVYRNALKQHGHRVEDGKVSLMLHTYIGDDVESVKQTVKQPFIDYLRSSASLVQRLLDTLPEKTNLHEETDLYEIAFERYWNKAALFGTTESVQELVDTLFYSGVDEFACLVDFGLNDNEVMTSLERLSKLKCSFQTKKRNLQTVGYKPITMLQTTPARMKHLLADPGSATFLKSLDTLIIGGEAFPTELIEPLQSKTSANIINAYGPTETTIWSALSEVKPCMHKIHIGKPLKGETIFILDEFYRVMPPGMPGEIVIGGSGVVRGYSNRPDLNIEKFVTLPKQLGGARAFKTGDRGCLRADGSIEFLGRKDYQVKLNGYRIELEEIEQVIRGVDGIVNVVVYDFESQDYSGKQLVALIVAQSQLNMSNVREVLFSKLPRYMVPKRLIQTESIPLNRNGKIDRHAARLAKLEETQAQNSYVAPKDEFEVLLAQAWEQVLGKNSIGIKDDFFALGGDSISAMRVTALLHKQGVYIDVKAIFERPTIAGLAEMNVMHSKVSETKQAQDAIARTSQKRRQDPYRFGAMTTKESEQVREAISKKTMSGDRK